MNDETTTNTEDELLEANPADDSIGETSKVRPAKVATKHTANSSKITNSEDDEKKK